MLYTVHLCVFQAKKKGAAAEKKKQKENDYLQRMEKVSCLYWLLKCKTTAPWMNIFELIKNTKLQSKDLCIKM